MRTGAVGRWAGPMMLAGRHMKESGMVMSPPDEVWFVPGFAELGTAGDVLSAALETAHMLPPDRLGSLLRRAGTAIGAADVSTWLIDYGLTSLVPIDDEAVRSDDVELGAAIPVAGTTAGRAFARTEAIEADRPTPHRWVPMLDGTERLGVLRFGFAAPMTERQRRLSDALASLGGALLVSKRAHTDHYAMRRRQQQMNLAAEMQWRQLPPLESSMPTVAVAGLVEPAYEVGGDGFDYSLNGSLLDLTIYDAVGHGLHAALLSALMIATLRHGRRRELGPAERLALADESIGANFPGDYITAQVAELSTLTGQLTWANAGHPLPLLVRDGRAVGDLPCAPRPPVGMASLQTTPTTVESVQLQPGDRVLFYTDGLVEGGRRGGSRFGLERLVDLLERANGERLGCAETIRRLGNNVLEHAAYELTDDATMMLVEWRGLPADPEAGAFARTHDTSSC